MTEDQIRLIVRSEFASLLRDMLATMGERTRAGSPPPGYLAALLSALPVGASMTATELRERVPAEVRLSPTQTGQLLARAVGRVMDGRILRKLRSDRGCSLYRLEPVSPPSPSP